MATSLASSAKLQNIYAGIIKPIEERSIYGNKIIIADIIKIRTNEGEIQKAYENIVANKTLIATISGLYNNVQMITAEFQSAAATGDNDITKAVAGKWTTFSIADASNKDIAGSAIKTTTYNGGNLVGLDNNFDGTNGTVTNSDRIIKAFQGALTSMATDLRYIDFVNQQLVSTIAQKETSTQDLQDQIDILTSNDVFAANKERINISSQQSMDTSLAIQDIRLMQELLNVLKQSFAT